MKGNVLSAHERKKIFNKFELHSETARIFEMLLSQNNHQNFVADVYRQAPDRASQLSLTGRQFLVRTNFICTVVLVQNCT